MSLSAIFKDAKQHFYDSHQHPVNIAIHHTVNVAAIVGIIWFFFDWKIGLSIIAVAAVIPPFGHLLFEKNKPATLKYPGISIPASFAWSFENAFGLKSLLQPLFKPGPDN